MTLEENMDLQEEEEEEEEEEGEGGDSVQASLKGDIFWKFHFFSASIR